MLMQRLGYAGIGIKKFEQKHNQPIIKLKELVLAKYVMAALVNRLLNDMRLYRLLAVHYMLFTI